MSQLDLTVITLDAITSERWTASDWNRWTPQVQYAWTASSESQACGRERKLLRMGLVSSNCERPSSALGPYFVGILSAGTFWPVTRSFVALSSGRATNFLGANVDPWNVVKTSEGDCSSVAELARSARLEC